jgi:hypothetical protein
MSRLHKKITKKKYYLLLIFNNIDKVFFPTLGLDYELTLGSDTKAKDGVEIKWWDDFWIRAGAGLDFFVSEKMFIRGHLIYGLSLPVGGEADIGVDYGHGLLN